MKKHLYIIETDKQPINCINSKMKFCSKYGKNKWQVLSEEHQLVYKMLIQFFKTGHAYAEAPSVESFKKIPKNFSLIFEWYFSVY